MERDFNALMHTISTALQAVTERPGEAAAMPLLTQLQEVLTPLAQRPAAEWGGGRCAGADSHRVTPRRLGHADVRL